MSLEFAKELLETPDKIKRLLLNFFRVSINLILGRFLYVKWFGTYNLAGWKEWHQWAESIFSGDLLLWGALLVLSDFLLFSLLPGLSFIILHLLTRLTKKVRTLNGFEVMDLLRHLSFIDIATRVKGTRQIKAGANTQDIYTQAVKLTKEDGHEAVTSFKRSFISNIWDQYVALTIIYFTVLPFWTYATIVLVLLVTLGIILLAGYVLLSWIMDIFTVNAREFAFQLGVLIWQKKAIDAFIDAGIPIFETVDEKTKIILWNVNLQSKTYILHFYHTKSVIGESVPRHYVEFQNTGYQFIVIANAHLSSDAQKLADTLKNVLFIVAASVDDIEKNIKLFIGEGQTDRKS